MSKQRWLVPAGITLALTAGLTFVARRSFRSVGPIIHSGSKSDIKKSEPVGETDADSNDKTYRADIGEAGAGVGVGGVQHSTTGKSESWTMPFSDKWFSRFWLGPSQAALEDAMVDQFKMEDYSGGNGDYQH